MHTNSTTGGMEGYAQETANKTGISPPTLYQTRRESNRFLSPSLLMGRRAIFTAGGGRVPHHFQSVPNLALTIERMPCVERHKTNLARRSSADPGEMPFPRSFSASLNLARLYCNNKGSTAPCENSPRVRGEGGEEVERIPCAFANEKARSSGAPQANVFSSHLLLFLPSSWPLPPTLFIFLHPIRTRTGGIPELPIYSQPGWQKAEHF